MSAYYHIERLRNLGLLPPSGFVFVAFPVLIEETTAAWTRAVAFVPAGERADMTMQAGQKSGQADQAELTPPVVFDMLLAYKNTAMPDRSDRTRRLRRDRRGIEHVPPGSQEAAT